jgi:hypothetical protein
MTPMRPRESSRRPSGHRSRGGRWPAGASWLTWVDLRRRDRTWSTRCGGAVSLAETPVDDYNTIDLLDRLIGSSVELLATDAAGIMLTDPRADLRAVAASSEDASSELHG